MKFTKERLLNILSEDLSQANTTNQPGGSANVLRALTDPNALKTANDSLNKWGDIKKKMDSVMMKEADGNDDFEEVIDNLFMKKYGMTYFRDTYTPPPPAAPDPQGKLFPTPSIDMRHLVFSQLTPEAQTNFIMKQRRTYGDTSVEPVVKLLQAGEIMKAYHILKNMNESLANSEVFRIIAEAERPRITKGEILEFLKKHNK